MNDQTFLTATTGFERSEFDEGFEYFSINLSRERIAELLVLIKMAKKCEKQFPDFRFLVLEDEDGEWLSATDVQDELGDDADLISQDEFLPVRDLNLPSSITRQQELLVRHDGVLWSCNAGAGDADWMVDTCLLNEMQLRSMSAALEQPPLVFK